MSFILCFAVLAAWLEPVEDGTESKYEIRLKELDATFKFNKKLNVWEIKKRVLALLQEPTTDVGRQALARAMWKSLGEGEHFKATDYYLIWRGHELLLKYRDGAPQAVDGLIAKINNREKLPVSNSLRTEMGMFATEILIDAFEYEGPSPIKTDRLDADALKELFRWLRADRPKG